MQTAQDTPHTVPPPVAARSETRRQAILEAALGLFTAQGFVKTTMESIRQRASASTGSLYHHFKSKEQLAAELYLEGIRNYQDGLAQELARQGGTAEGGIRGVVEYHLGWIVDHPSWARYLIQSREADFVSATKPELRRLNREMSRHFTTWVAPFIETGEVVRLPDDLYQALLIGPAQNYARAWLSGRARTDLEVATEVLSKAAWKSLRNRP